MCKLVAAAVFDFHRNDTRTDTCKYTKKCTRTQRKYGNVCTRKHQLKYAKAY